MTRLTRFQCKEICIASGCLQIKHLTNNLFGGEVTLHKYVSSALSYGLMDIIVPQLEIGGLKMEFIGRILSIEVSCSKENLRDRMPIC